jgi:hypothetical protein
MPQMSKVSRNNTAIVKENGKTTVILHSTPVVSFDEKTITLDNGGWITATTVCRMTQVSREYDLGFSVGRKNGTMEARYKGVDIPFNGNTLTIQRNEKKAYTPLTGAKCGCRRGVQRDNCPNCEGTGNVIDFAAIRARNNA